LKETTMSTLMEDDIKRWTAKRKTALVLEIIQGKTTISEANRAFDLSPSEVEQWVDEGKRGMENALLAGELSIGVLHDTAAYRHQERVALEFTAPREGIMALEQVLSVTRGTQMTELAHAWINHMLSPEVQKLMAEDLWFSPVRRDMALEERFRGKLLTTPLPGQDEDSLLMKDLGLRPFREGRGGAPL
jgi:spermidine/putrescine-binding protein